MSIFYEPREVLMLLEVFHAQWVIVELPPRTFEYMDAQRQLTGEGPVQVIRMFRSGLAHAAEEFERAYAERSGITVEQLRELGRVVRPCTCGEDYCEGWQSVPVPTAAEIDDPSKPWAR